MRPSSAAALIACLLLAGCALRAPRVGYPPAPPTHTIYVHEAGWHAGLIVSVSEVPRALWPEIEAFAGYRYVRVGWGDKDFYPAPDFNLWFALKALFWPTASVLHIVAFDEAPAAFYPGSDLIALPVSAAGFRRLCRFVHASYAHDAQGKPVVLGPGLYGVSRFYLSDLSYHALRTSNVWTAQALELAGVPVRPALAPTSEMLFWQLRGIEGKDRAAAGSRPPADSARQR